MIQHIQARAEALLPELRQIRRHLHRHPELSFREYKTMEFVAGHLEKDGIPFRKNISGTGIIALIRGNNPDKKCIALRADMDALPIEEANDTEYRSQNKGVMHACGHDVHTTCLLGAAYILQEIKDQLEGSVKLIFQPGEEQSPGGAGLMIRAGVLEAPRPEQIFALHVDPSLPSGTAGFKSGPYMASSDEIHIKVTGKGGHAALPHLTADPIAISALLITSLQQVISRCSNPLLPSVLSFGKIAGGSATNVIPGEVEILGTFRTFDEAWRKEAKIRIQKIVTHTAEAFGAGIALNMPPGYPALHNDPETTGWAKAFAEDYLGKDQVRNLALRMTSEDFAFYSQRVKACFFRLGTNKNDQEFTAPVHHARFDIDESALAVGAGMLSGLAYQSLMEK